MDESKKSSEPVIDVIKLMTVTDKSFEKGLQEGKLPHEILGISEEGIGELYYLAMVLLEEKEFELAADAFFFLLSLDSINGEFWVRLGNAEQGKGEYNAALEAYLFAGFYEPEDPFPHIYSAQCCKALGEDEAVEVFKKSALERARSANLDQVVEFIETEAIQS